MTPHGNWEQSQEWERAWWLNNPSLHPEEQQKNTLISKLLLINGPDLEGKSIIDIGCGPFSLLLNVKQHTEKPAQRVALDPNNYGELDSKYALAGIERSYVKGEDISHHLNFDEAWIYNVLQHVEDPIRVLNNAVNIAKRVRIFEWINVPPYTGHLHQLSEGVLDSQFESNFKSCAWNPVLRVTGTINMDGLVSSAGNVYIAIWEKPS